MLETFEVSSSAKKSWRVTLKRYGFELDSPVTAINYQNAKKTSVFNWQTSQVKLFFEFKLLECKKVDSTSKKAIKVENK